MDKNRIVSVARSCIGTPYAHEGRRIGVELDCIGLVICVGWELGFISRDWDYRNYSRNPNGEIVNVARQKLGRELRQDELEAGDVVVMRFGNGLPQHIGIAADYKYGGLSLIHANLLHKKTEEHRLIFGKQMQFVTGFEFK